MTSLAYVKKKEIEMTVQELLDILSIVENKNQYVAVRVHGVEFGDTTIDDVCLEEQKYTNKDICWLEIPDDSVLHETY